MCEFPCRCVLVSPRVTAAFGCDGHHSECPIRPLGNLNLPSWEWCPAGSAGSAGSAGGCRGPRGGGGGRGRGGGGGGQGAAGAGGQDAGPPPAGRGARP